MATERKVGEVERLTDFDGYGNSARAIGVKYGKYVNEDEYVIIPWEYGKEKVRFQLPGEKDIQIRPFKSGVAVVSADFNTEWDRREPDKWETRHVMVTPSGYTIRLDADSPDLEQCEAVKYARSIYEKPAEILKIDKHIDMASSYIIKAYIDIAKAGLEDTLARAGEDFQRSKLARSHYPSPSERREYRAIDAKYEKTITTVKKLAEKVAAKFRQLEERLERKNAQTLSGKTDAAKESIAAIFNEPQREA